MATKISKEMQKMIDNYGNQIKTLKDSQTAVRTRPTMYIGPLGNNGMLNMIREIFQNAIDQIVLPESPCDHFNLYYNEQTLEVICEDNGLGIPFDDIVRIMTSLHTSKNFEKQPYHYSSGLNGVGAKIVNFLSTEFTIESYRYDGTAARMDFKKGYPVDKAYKKIPNKNRIQGTRIRFIPDTDIMGDITLPWKKIYRLLKNIICQINLGAYCNFTAIDINGKEFNEKIINRDGILAVLYHKVKAPLIKPICIFEDDGFHKLNMAFCFDSGGEDGPESIEDVTAFSNLCPTTEGTHINGSIDGICRWFTQYMNGIYLANQKSKDKTKVTNADIKTGLNIMISAAHLEPEFTGQAKEILSNEDMLGFCKDVVMRGLDQWSKDNPQDLAKISKFFKEIAEIRQKGEKEKTKIVAKYDSNILSGLPKKYKRPLSKKNNELIIVEGDRQCALSLDAFRNTMWVVYI